MPGRGASTEAPAAAADESAAGRASWRPLTTPDRRVLAAEHRACSSRSALLLGHSYDTRIFMATGYLVGTGHDPVRAAQPDRVFHHAGFSVIASVGYPPPWPLLLGLIYRAVYAVVPSLLVYNSPSSCR